MHPSNAKTARGPARRRVSWLWPMDLLLIGIICSSRIVAQDSGLTLGQLRGQIAEELASQQGKFALAFEDLSTHETIYLNEHDQFHAASTMKTPVMIELYKLIGLGRLSLSDSIVVKNKFQSLADSSFFSLNPNDDSEVDLYQHLGEKRTVAELIYLMITLSSNLSTNLLIELAGAARVTQTMREMGAPNILVLRGVEDQKAFEKGMNNTLTAYDLMIIFQQMAEGKLVSPEASNSMIKILEDQKFNEIIPALLPVAVKVAHKTGSFSGVHHDGGIVFLPDGRRYVLVMLSKDLKDEEAAVKSMALVSEKLYRYMIR
jgi:beta-lactamase class A